ncbi:pseudaminic acid cytidylyltransferase [Neptunicella marina]|uniref:Pseudaminic acid cytidylyltransferase n=1 Tax=Neptunicella marina TaxID=2125989 RepID=A0A8J6LXV1_9ALTE|nr:pseudaminic acid cytidylyltransferase [Neptunicella marina]
MNLAVIPARGGSKRIPGKNIRQFAGKPLIAYSILAAQQSQLFDKIIVSTDDEKVAKVATEFGAEVPFMRPEDLSDDFTGTRPVTNHAIEFFQQQGQMPEFTCCIYATAPFLQAQYLLQGLNALKSKPAKAFAFSVTSFAFPIQRALELNENGPAPMFEQHIYQRSQDLTEAYHDAGQFYWGRSADYLSSKKIFSSDSEAVILPRHLVQDIDTLEDWHRAELMFNAYMREQDVT